MNSQQAIRALNLSIQLPDFLRSFVWKNSRNCLPDVREKVVLLMRKFTLKKQYGETFSNCPYQRSVTRLEMLREPFRILLFIEDQRTYIQVKMLHSRLKEWLFFTFLAFSCWLREEQLTWVPELTPFNILRSKYLKYMKYMKCFIICISLSASVCKNSLVVTIWGFHLPGNKSHFCQSKPCLASYCLLRNFSFRSASSWLTLFSMIWRVRVKKKRLRWFQTSCDLNRHVSRLALISMAFP